MSPTLRSGVIVPNVLSYFFGGGLRGLEKIPMRVGHLIGIGGVKIEHRKNLSSGEPFEIGGLDNSDVRSEERRGGKECDSTCRSRWSTYHKQKKRNKRIHTTRQRQIKKEKQR